MSWPGDYLGLIGAVQERIDRLDWEIRQRARSGPRVKVLTQLPGIGPFTALVIVAEAGGISRFASARQLASWAGLTPTVRGSDRVRRGPGHGTASSGAGSSPRWGWRSASVLCFERVPAWSVVWVLAGDIGECRGWLLCSSSA